ncbi:MAG: hypothetical protein U0R19_28560 [Bryobacteraceae bacterium]
MPTRPATERTLRLSAKLIPQATICFSPLSAFQIWLAINVKARKPTIGTPSLRIARFSRQALTEGVATHRIDGVPVRIYSPAKTVADCFKYRYKIGIDVAIEALRDALRRRKATPGQIHRYAKICRVANVIRPYLESAV